MIEELRKRWWEECVDRHGRNLCNMLFETVEVFLSDCVKTRGIDLCLGVAELLIEMDVRRSVAYRVRDVVKVVKIPSVEPEAVVIKDNVVGVLYKMPCIFMLGVAADKSVAGFVWPRDVSVN